MLDIGDLQPVGMELLSGSDLIESLDSLSDNEIRVVVGGKKTTGGNVVIVNNLAYGFDPHGSGIFGPVTNIVV